MCEKNARWRLNFIRAPPKPDWYAGCTNGIGKHEANQSMKREKYGLRVVVIFEGRDGARRRFVRERYNAF